MGIEKGRPKKKAAKVKIIVSFLKEQGYCPKVDDDGDVAFKFEGSTYFIDEAGSDEEFFRLVYPNFWPIETMEEENNSKIALNEVNCELKVAKVFQIRDSVWAAIEMFIDPFENFQNVFSRCLGCLQHSANLFSEKMRSMRDKDHLGDAYKEPGDPLID